MRDQVKNWKDLLLRMAIVEGLLIYPENSMNNGHEINGAM